MQNIVKSVWSEIDMIQRKKQRVLVAIDGRCAAGKTTLAAHLRDVCECNVIHMDHFFLTPELRTQERLGEPGGNIDHERFLNEVLAPFRQDEDFSYRPYDCRKQDFTEAVIIKRKEVNIIEGSYSCHPLLTPYYDLKIFLSIDPEEQLIRIQKRNGTEQANIFQKRWIPLEETYFSFFHIQDIVDLHYNVSDISLRSFK